MILTVTLNPSMDYLYTIDSFKLGEQNRFSAPTKMVGGKGINAGRTATILGADVLTANILAGKNGEAVRQELEQESFKSYFLSVAGETRNAITIMHDNQTQTELVEFGPLVDSVTEEKLLAKIIEFCHVYPEINVISLSGSANSKNLKLYQQFVSALSQQVKRKIKIITDISGKQLANVLAGQTLPYLIKPNIHEFSELIQQPLQTKADILSHLAHPSLKKLPLMIISCGSEGAIAKHYERVYDLTIPKIDLVNPTGSGDATVGGAAYAMDKGLPIVEVLKYAMAAGVANAMEAAVGFVQAPQVATLVKEVHVTEIT